MGGLARELIASTVESIVASVSLVSGSDSECQVVYAVHVQEQDCDFASRTRSLGLPGPGGRRRLGLGLKSLPPTVRRAQVIAGNKRGGPDLTSAQKEKKNVCSWRAADAVIYSFADMNLKYNVRTVFCIGRGK